MIDLREKDRLAIEELAKNYLAKGTELRANKKASQTSSLFKYQ
ncbi:hypothetical protein [Vibrio sp. JC009]|nr:hypothetical protein [Vibrio sp. JC009]